MWFFPERHPAGRQGTEFTIWSRPIERWDGEFKCEVLTVEAPNTLSFRWYGGDKELKGFGRYMDTKVTWTLTPLADGGTHFRFVHEGFGTDPRIGGRGQRYGQGVGRACLRSLAKRLPDLVLHGA